MQDPIKEFAKLSSEERNYHLRVRTHIEREALIEKWVESEYISMTDVFALDPEYERVAMQYLCGDPQKQIMPVGGTFTIKPIGDPFDFEIGSSRNKRKYIRISRATPMEARRAAVILALYGKDSNKETMRGMVEEVLPPALLALRSPEKTHKAKK